MPRTPIPCVDGPAPCPCRYHAAIKARLRTRRQVGVTGKFNAWKRSHDDLLLTHLARGATPEEIAQTLTDRFHVPRTANAVKLRINRLGYSMLDGWWTEAEVCRRLGLSVRNLRELGEPGRVLAGSPYGAWTRFRITDVEAFVTTHAGRFIDPRRIRDPRLRTLAETNAIVNRRRAAL